jgi:hypothetical protein
MNATAILFIIGGICGLVVDARIGWLCILLAGLLMVL